MRATPPKRTRKNTKLIIFVVALAVIAGIALATYIYKQQPQNASTSSNSTQTKPSDQQGNQKDPATNGQSSDSDQKQQAADDEANNKPSDGSAVTPNSPTFSNDSISFTTQTSNDSLVVVTKLQSFSGSGTCTIALKNGSSSVTESAQVIYQEEYSSCAGFSIPLSKLQQSGTWNITLSVTTSKGTFSKAGTYMR